MTEFLKNLTVASVLPAFAMLVVGMLAIRVIMKLVDKSMAKSKLEKAAVSLIRSLLQSAAVRLLQELQQPFPGITAGKGHGVLHGKIL